MTPRRMLQAPIPMWPGDQFLENLRQTFFGRGLEGSRTAPVWMMMFNSLVMAMMIAVGKIAISLLSAFAIVYFKFPFRMGFFWMIFITLMLPVEVRILPTFEVVADLGMLNSYWGLTVPLIASATATFMFRQVFLTIPDEMLESARIDGAGPMRFFWDILLPLSRTNIAALFVILFIYGWNQYLWPLLITTDANMMTIVVSIKQMLEAAEADAALEHHHDDRASGHAAADRGRDHHAKALCQRADRDRQIGRPDRWLKSNSTR